MVAFTLIAILKVLLPHVIRAAILFYGTKIGIKVADKTADEIADALNEILFGLEEE